MAWSRFSAVKIRSSCSSTGAAGCTSGWRWRTYPRTMTKMDRQNKLVTERESERERHTLQHTHTFHGRYCGTVDGRPEPSTCTGHADRRPSRRVGRRHPSKRCGATTSHTTDRRTSMRMRGKSRVQMMEAENGHTSHTQTTHKDKHTLKHRVPWLQLGMMRMTAWISSR